MDRYEEFLHRCRKALPDVNIPANLPRRRLGRSADLCERLIGYIAAGEKTGVFSQPEDFGGGRLPAGGDLAVLVDFGEVPRCLIRYEECRVMPFRDVGAEHTAIETPALRDLETWRRFHRTYWSPVLEARGERFHDDLPLVFQRFTCLHAD